MPFDTTPVFFVVLAVKRQFEKCTRNYSLRDAPPDGFDTQKYGVISRIKSKEYCLQQRPLPPVYRLDRENRSNCYKS